MYNDISQNDYTFVENLSEDFYGVKLRGGMWNDVIIVYGQVSIKEDNDQATLKFTYNIQDSAKYQPDELEKNEAFNTHLGDILTHIINGKFEEEAGELARLEE